MWLLELLKNYFRFIDFKQMQRIGMSALERPILFVSETFDMEPDMEHQGLFSVKIYVQKQSFEGVL